MENTMKLTVVVLLHCVSMSWCQTCTLPNTIADYRLHFATGTCSTASTCHAAADASYNFDCGPDRCCIDQPVTCFTTGFTGQCIGEEYCAGAGGSTASGLCSGPFDLLCCQLPQASTPSFFPAFDSLPPATNVTNVVIPDAWQGKAVNVLDVSASRASLTVIGGSTSAYFIRLFAADLLLDSYTDATHIAMDIRPSSSFALGESGIASVTLVFLERNATGHCVAYDVGKEDALPADIAATDTYTYFSPISSFMLASTGPPMCGFGVQLKATGSGTFGSDTLTVQGVRLVRQTLPATALSMPPYVAPTTSSSSGSGGATSADSSTTSDGGSTSAATDAPATGSSTSAGDSNGGNSTQAPGEGPASSADGSDDQESTILGLPVVVFVVIVAAAVVGCVLLLTACMCGVACNVGRRMGRGGGHGGPGSGTYGAYREGYTRRSSRGRSRRGTDTGLSSQYPAPYASASGRRRRSRFPSDAMTASTLPPPGNAPYSTMANGGDVQMAQLDRTDGIYQPFSAIGTLQSDEEYAAVAASSAQYRSPGTIVPALPAAGSDDGFGYPSIPSGTSGEYGSTKEVDPSKKAY